MVDRLSALGGAHGFSDLYMWGSCSYGQQGSARIPVASRGLHSARTWTPELMNDIQLSSLTLQKVVLGSSRSLGLTTDGQVYQWGRRYGASVDDNEIFLPRMLLWGDVSWQPEQVCFPDELPKWLEAFKKDNDGFNLELIEEIKNSWIEPPLSRRRVTDIFSGYTHCAFIVAGSDRQQELWTMGSNRHGQLGCGKSLSSCEPRRVEFAGMQFSRRCAALVSDTPARTEDVTVKGFLSVSLGMYHSVAVTYSSGVTEHNTTVWVWGKGVSGELGLSVPLSVSRPIQLAELDERGICQVAAGERHTIALSRSGAVYAFGYFSRSCIVYAPMRIETLSQREHPIVAVGAGVRYSAFLDSSGQPWLWPGRNGDMSVDTLPSVEATSISLDVSTAEQPWRRCPAGHRLQEFRTPRVGFVCDDCNKRMSRSSRMYGCRLCNFDRCSICYDLVKRATSQGSLPALSSSGLSSVDLSEEKRPTSDMGDADQEHLVENLQRLHESKQLLAGAVRSTKIVDMVCGPCMMVMIASDGCVYFRQTAVAAQGALPALASFSLLTGETLRLHLPSSPFVVSHSSESNTSYVPARSILKRHQAQGGANADDTKEEARSESELDGTEAADGVSLDLAPQRAVSAAVGLDHAAILVSSQASTGFGQFLRSASQSASLFADVTLLCGKCRLLCHRVVLHSRLGNFRVDYFPSDCVLVEVSGVSGFSQGCHSGAADSLERERQASLRLSADSLVALVDWAYLGSTRSSETYSTHIFEELLRFARVWDVSSLRRYLIQTNAEKRHQEDTTRSRSDNGDDVMPIGDAHLVHLASRIAASSGVRLERTLWCGPLDENSTAAAESGADGALGGEAEEKRPDVSIDVDESAASLRTEDVLDRDKIRTESESESRPEFEHVDKCDRSRLLLDGDLLRALDNTAPELASDVTFVVGGKEIHAHRCVLSLRVPYFQRMFRHSEHRSSQEMPDLSTRSPPAESKGAVDMSHSALCTDDRVIVLSDCAYSTFMACMEWVYAGGLSQAVRESSEALSELLVLADLYGVEELKGHCEMLLFRVVFADCCNGPTKEPSIPLAGISEKREQRKRQRRIQLQQGNTNNSPQPTEQATPPRSFDSSHRVPSAENKADRQVAWMADTGISEQRTFTQSSSGQVPVTAQESPSAGRVTAELQVTPRKITSPDAVPTSGNRNILQWLAFARVYNAQLFTKLVLSSSLAEATPQLVTAVSNARKATHGIHGSQGTFRVASLDGDGKELTDHADTLSLGLEDKPNGSTAAFDLDEETLTDIVRDACIKSTALRKINLESPELSVVSKWDLAHMEKPYIWVLMLCLFRSLFLLAASLLALWKAQDFDEGLFPTGINGTWTNVTTLAPQRTGWSTEGRPSWLLVFSLFSVVVVLSFLLQLAHLEHRRMYQISWWRHRQVVKVQSLLSDSKATLDGLMDALLRYSQDYALPTHIPTSASRPHVARPASAPLQSVVTECASPQSLVVIPSSLALADHAPSDFSLPGTLQSSEEDPLARAERAERALPTSARMDLPDINDTDEKSGSSYGRPHGTPVHPSSEISNDADDEKIPATPALHFRPLRLKTTLKGSNSHVGFSAFVRAENTTEEKKRDLDTASSDSPVPNSSQLSFVNALSNEVREESDRISSYMRVCQRSAKELYVKPSTADMFFVCKSGLCALCVSLSFMLLGDFLDVGSLSLVGAWTPLLFFDSLCVVELCFHVYTDVKMRIALVQESFPHSRCSRLCWYTFLTLLCILKALVSPTGLFIIQTLLLASQTIGWIMITWWIVFSPVLSVMMLLSGVLAVVDLMLVGTVLAMTIPAAARHIEETIESVVARHPHWRLVAVSIALLQWLSVTMLCSLVFMVLRLEGDTSVTVTKIFSPFMVFQALVGVSFCWIFHIRQFAFANFYHVWRR